MFLERYKPTTSLTNIDDFFKSFWDERPWAMLEKWAKESAKMMPSLNVYEEGDNYIVEASVPGMDKKDIEINISDNILTIKGEVKEEKKEEDKKRNYFHKEIVQSSFTRSISLPDNVDPQKIKAKYDKGILKITIPKEKENKNVKKIKIE